MKKPPMIRVIGGYEYELFNGEYGPAGKGPHGAYTKEQAEEQAKLWRTSAEGMTRKIKVPGTEWYFIYVR
jgi:hypothetical protein